MSQTDLEVVRSAIEAWNRRDAELWLSYAMPDVEWMSARGRSREMMRIAQ